MKSLIKKLLRESLTINEEITAYHRSAHNFNKFDTTKMGSGSGRQDFGWGIYLSNNINVSREYGKYLYNVTIFKDKNPSQYTLMDYKQTQKDLVIKIIEAIYEYHNENFNIEQFNLYYQYGKEYLELKKQLKYKLEKIDPDLDDINLDEIMDDKNQDTWFYIKNYTKNNNEVNNIFNTLTSLPDITFNDYGFDIIGGKHFYQNISRLLGGDKKASLFLLKNGIDGLIVKHGENQIDYVIFNGDDITITNKIDSNPEGTY